MTPSFEEKIAATQQALDELERRQKALRDDGSEHPQVRKLALASFAMLIRELKEDLGRYRIGKTRPSTHLLQDESELNNTRQKLAELEERYQNLKSSRQGEREIVEIQRTSMKKIINQLKEEVGLYLAHHPEKQNLMPSSLPQPKRTPAA